MANWTENEVKWTVRDYFSMLAKELSGKSYSKTEHRRKLIKLLNGRTNGSIEMKHMNISAILTDLGLPYINGYKPIFNYQKLAAEMVVDFLSANKMYLEGEFEAFSDTATEKKKPNNYKSAKESPPETKEKKLNRTPAIRGPFKINYLLREQQNSVLGKNGEAFIMDYEKWRLKSEGKEDLSEKIEWVSEYDDGAGFDILSKNIDGTDRLIEVKTTKLTKESPFFFSRRELLVSKENADKYFLYRVFNFSSQAKLFLLQGSFDKFCTHEPVIFKGLPFPPDRRS